MPADESPSTPVRRVRLIGVGPGDPEQVTLEAVHAMRSVAFFVVSDKASVGGMPDPLVNARDRLLDRHLGYEPEIVRVEAPSQRRAPEGTGSAWHDARADAYERALLAHEGDVGFLLWGDPSFYDSTIRVLDRVRERGHLAFEVDVVPGISSIQLLAARHRIVLHEVGQPLHVTTARLLGEAVEQGLDNLVVMLNRTLELDGLEEWSIWWGANLGTAHERLVSGLVGDVRPEIEAARTEVAGAAGWVMDILLLRRPDAAPAGGGVPGRPS